MPSPIRAATIAALLVPAAACGQAPAEPPAAPMQAGPAGAGMTFPQFETRRMGRLLAMDTDGDGRVSRAEFIAGSASGPASGKGDPARRFAHLDANGDGFVDRGEIDTMLKRRFDRIDADHDGIATPAERAAAHKGQAQSDDNG